MVSIFDVKCHFTIAAVNITLWMLQPLDSFWDQDVRCDLFSSWNFLAAFHLFPEDRIGPSKCALVSIIVLNALENVTSLLSTLSEGFSHCSPVQRLGVGPSRSSLRVIHSLHAELLVYDLLGSVYLRAWHQHS